MIINVLMLQISSIMTGSNNLASIWITFYILQIKSKEKHHYVCSVLSNPKPSNPLIQQLSNTIWIYRFNHLLQNLDNFFKTFCHCTWWAYFNTHNNMTRVVHAMCWFFQLLAHIFKTLPLFLNFTHKSKNYTHTNAKCLTSSKMKHCIENITNTSQKQTFANTFP